MATRPAIFKWRQTEPSLILCAVRWYLRYSLSLRDVEELLEDRGCNVDHTTVWRWVQCYSPELEQRMRRHLKSTNKSWRVDETYVRVKGRWCYPYRAIDSTGATIDFPCCQHRVTQMLPSACFVRRSAIYPILNLELSTPTGRRSTAPRSPTVRRKGQCSRPLNIQYRGAVGSHIP